MLTNCVIKLLLRIHDRELRIKTGRTKGLKNL